MKQPAWDRFWCATALIAVVLLYGWTVDSVGGLTPPARTSAPNDYYNHLVAGFIQKHLYMDLEPSEGLKALADPYDPTQNAPHRLTDTSYYRGRYYLYFGPGPAITLLLPFRLLTGLYLPTPWAMWIFCSLGFLAASGVWLAMRARYFATSPTWAGIAGVLVIGVGSGAGILLRRPFFWELAGAGGFAFAMLALAAIYRAVHTERRPVAWLGIAGLLLGLAAASRPTYVFTGPLLAVPLLVWAQIEGFTGRWWRMAIAGAVGFGAMGVALLAYNYARFGNPLETGHNYLLSVAYESKVRLFSLEHLLFNARMYYLLPGQWSWYPPFIAPVPVARADMPAGFYTVDDPIGLLRIFPIAILALAAPAALFLYQGIERIRLRALVLGYGIIFGCASAVILLYVATIPRYAVDYLPALMLLVATGLLVLTTIRQPTLARALRSGIGVLTVVSLAMGALMIFDLGRLLSHTQPATIRRVTAITGRLEALTDQWHHIHYGPIELQVQFSAFSAPHTETLITAGEPKRPDRVLIDYRSPTQVRFGLQPANGPTRWSRTQEIDLSRPHRVGIELGSFYPALEHRVFADAGFEKASWLQHRAEISVDGKRVLRAFSDFEWSRRGAPTAADSSFKGKIVEISRRPAAIAGRTIDGLENLFLGFTLPIDRRGHRFPLISTGKPDAADVLVIEPLDNERARLGYEHSGNSIVWSEPFSCAASAKHEIELRQTEDGWAPASPGTRLLVAWLNGKQIWLARVPAFAAEADDVVFGRTKGTAAAEELSGGVIAREAAPTVTRIGSTLVLRVIMPKGIKGSWQPILAVGRNGGADVLSVNYMGLDVAQFRYDHWAAPLIVGTSTPVDSALGHDLEITLPSFARDSFGQSANGEVRVRLDGQEVIHAPGAAFGFSSETFFLGENRVGATLDDAFFRGCFVQRDWVDIPAATSR